MTYCVGIKLDAGLVFLSDSRTNAGLDQISTFRKMMVYERPGDRFMVLLSAGNLSISQSVREILQVEKLDNGDQPPLTIWNAASMFERTSRARPQICSQLTGLRLCGMAELPRCPAANGSSASRTSVRCRWRISSAIFSSVAAIRASVET